MTSPTHCTVPNCRTPSRTPAVALAQPGTPAAKAAAPLARIVRRLRVRREITESFPRTHLLPAVMVGAGRPSTARGAELAKSVDGRPAPTMTAWGEGGSTAALVLAQVLSVMAGLVPAIRLSVMAGLVPAILAS